jgi:hypothetical protein
VDIHPWEEGEDGAQFENRIVLIQPAEWFIYLHLEYFLLDFSRICSLFLGLCPLLCTELPCQAQQL